MLTYTPNVHGSTIWNLLHNDRFIGWLFINPEEKENIFKISSRAELVDISIDLNELNHIVSEIRAKPNLTEETK